jgi:hypothetical protein
VRRLFFRIRHLLRLRSWHRDDRMWCVAFSISVAVHLGLILLCAGLYWGLVPSTVLFGIDTRWSQPPLIEELELEEFVLLPPLKTQQAGGEMTQPSPVLKSLKMTSSSFPPSFRVIFSEHSDEVPQFEELFEDAGEFFGDSQFSNSGSGTGIGRGEGFFGSNAKGKKFVYVVDASRSMNHPHDSAARTRFNRLKIELVKSVLSLNGNDDFYIVFFNENPIPMSARSMQPAYPANRRRYLQWAAKMRADGKTDPRKALSLALKLNPDVIYFLTDGAFEFKVDRFLRKVSQNRTAIHTFAFGNREAEDALRALAAANGGNYHFVP